MYAIFCTLINDSQLTYVDYIKVSVISIVVIVGIFRLFFWVQRHNYVFKTRCLKIRLDDYIPFWPQWVWIYSGLYYVIFGLGLFYLQSHKDIMQILFGCSALGLIQCLLFFFIPCTVPREWRAYEVTSHSTAFLRLIQDLDNGRNCVPSMHMSVATYAALISFPVIGIWSYVYIFLIALSCLFVKQHQILDILPGVALGYFVYEIIL